LKPLKFTTRMVNILNTALGIKVPEAEVHVQAEDVQDSNYTIIMQLYCTNLDKKDLFGKVSITFIVCMLLLQAFLTRLLTYSYQMLLVP